jgi:hypothetical protein
MISEEKVFTCEYMNSKFSMTSFLWPFSLFFILPMEPIHKKPTIYKKGVQWRKPINQKPSWKVVRFTITFSESNDFTSDGEKDSERLNEKDWGIGFRVPEMRESEKDWKQTNAIEEEDELDDDYLMMISAKLEMKGWRKGGIATEEEMKEQRKFLFTKNR